MLSLFQIPPTSVAVKVEFNANSVGSSDVIPVDNSETELNWEVFYGVPEITENIIDDLLSNPLVCT